MLANGGIVVSATSHQMMLNNRTSSSFMKPKQPEPSPSKQPK
jgi:hypothetical protein